MKKKITLGVSIALALVLTLSATFAWFTATDTRVNHFETSDTPAANVELLEVFEEPEDWLPGQEITKQVAVVNTGESPALTRVYFEEVLSLIKPYADSTAKYAGAEGQTPALFNAGAYDSWETLSRATAGANTGVKLAADYAGLVVKAISTTTGTGSAARTSYEFVAYAPISISAPSNEEFNGKNQKVSATFSLDADTKVLTLSNITYAVSDGKNEATFDWSAAPSPLASDILTSRVENALKTANPTLYGNYIELNYGALNAAITDAEWFYNTDDGYFYYIGTVDPGTATANLLNSVTLNSAADSNYAKLSYDLIVNMEAIQNTADALDAIWGINATSNAPLFAALDAFCE